MSSVKPSAKIPPKPGKDVVYLDVDDDITTIIDKVEGAKNKVVALVLPKRFATMQSIVNMRLLKRSASSAEKNVVLITSEAALMPLAGAAGIHVAKNLQSKPEIPPSPVDIPQEKPSVPEDPDAEIDEKDTKLDYHRSIGELAAAKSVDEPDTIPLDDEDEAEEEPAKSPAKSKPSKDKKLKIPNFERFRLLLTAGALGLVLLIVFIIMALFVWPKATITLKTEATPLSSAFELTTSASAKALDTKQGIIPAALKTSDLTSSQQVQATGQQNKGDKATGSITMSICVTGSSPDDVPAGTGVSANGLTYITQQTAHFSPTFQTCGNGSGVLAQSNNVDITAQSAGSKYNVSDTTFSVRSDVTGTGSASGGTDNIVTILSSSDVNSAKDKISDQDKNDFANKFKKDLTDQSYYIIESTFKVKDPVLTSSPAVGQPASTANVTIKITYTALVIRKDDLKKAITDDLNKQIDQKKQKIGTDDVLKDVAVNVQSQSSSTVAALSITENTTAVPVIDTDFIKQQVGGKKAGEIKSILGGYPGVKEVEVKMSPFWVSKAPKKAGKIVIIQQQEKTPSSGS